MKREHQAWHAGATVVAGLAVAVLGYFAVGPHSGSWRASGTPAISPPSTLLSTPESISPQPAAYEPHAMARANEFPLECAPQEGLAEPCVYR